MICRSQSQVDIRPHDIARRVSHHTMSFPSFPSDPTYENSDAPPVIPPGVSIIGLHGAGASGKSSFLEAIQSWNSRHANTAGQDGQSPKVEHTVFLETFAGLKSATAELYPEMSTMKRLMNPSIQVKGLFGRLDFMNSNMLSSVWNYERLQHEKVQAWLSSLESKHSASSSSSSSPSPAPPLRWAWLDRNCVDAAAYAEGKNASAVGADFRPTLTLQTQQLGCGIWMDAHPDLICEHHRARAAKATGIGAKLVSKLMAAAPSIWMPTVTAVELVESWYKAHGIPFIRMSKFKASMRQRLGIDEDTDPSTVDIEWTDDTLEWLFEYMRGEMDQVPKPSRTPPRLIHPTPWMVKTMNWNDGEGTQANWH